MRVLKRLLWFGALASFPAWCQSLPPSSMPSVPTTKVLAVGHLTAASTTPGRQGVMPQEVQDTVRLYLTGKIDQWYVRKDQGGVVFILNVGSVAEAQSLLDKLQLAREKLMQFDLIPMGPLSPLGLLLK